MENIVLIDHRTYRIKPGFMNQHLALYEEHGLDRKSTRLNSSHRT